MNSSSAAGDRCLFYTIVPLILFCAIALSCAPTWAQEAFDSVGYTGNQINTFDSFDSSGATGYQTNNSGHFTGSQTQMTGSQLPDAFSSDEIVGTAPILQGATNGIIGPQDGDATVIQGVYTWGTVVINNTDGPMTAKEIEFREILIRPVTCAEPLPPGVFPPMPQFPILPTPQLGDRIADSKGKAQSKKHFEKGKEFAKENKIRQAGDEFALAISFSTDESSIRSDISDFLQKQARHENNNGSDLRANWLRLAIVFDRSNSINTELLNDCLTEQGKNPHDRAYRESLAVQFESQENFRLAAAERSAIVMLDNTPMQHAKYGAALFEAKCDREALAELRIAVKSDWPEDRKVEQSDSHRRLAELFLKYSQIYSERGARASGIAILENATLDARRAVQLNPRNLKAVNLLLSALQEIVAMVPEEFDNHLFLGATYLLKGDFARADMEYQECERLDPVESRMRLARLSYKLMRSNPSRSDKGNLKRSIAALQELIDDDPDNDQLLLVMSRLQAQNADVAASKEALKQAHNIFWGN